jgi:hypothetical protein
MVFLAVQKLVFVDSGAGSNHVTIRCHGPGSRGQRFEVRVTLIQFSIEISIFQLDKYKYLLLIGGILFADLLIFARLQRCRKPPSLPKTRKEFLEINFGTFARHSSKRR